MNRQLERERNKLLISTEKLLEGPMILLGFIWLLLLVVELIWGLNKPLEYLSLGIWGVFIIDFVIKILLAPQKMRFLKKNWLTLISLLVPAMRIFRAFRFVRLLRGLRGIRLLRVVSSLNRSMRSLSATMSRRGFGYVMILSVIVIFAGAAGMYGLERPNPGFTDYGQALWWTAMRVITAGSDLWPATTEGKCLAFIIALYGYAVFGYVTATLATFFIGRDAEEKSTPIAGSSEIKELRNEISALTATVNEAMVKLHERK